MSEYILLVLVYFIQKCECCRESQMKMKQVDLALCYDSDGNRLTDARGSMKIAMQEPEGCHCYKCGL